jgi:hypothetical protein
MSGEGEGHWELKVGDLTGEKRVGKVTGTVGIREVPGGFSVEVFDDDGVRILPRVWDTFDEADAFALGFIEGLDQGMLNAITVLDKVHAIDKNKIEVLPQKVVGHGDDD